MARNLTTALKNALTGTQVTPIMLFYADFPSGAVRAWTGYGNLSWGGNTYAGVGHFGGIDRVDEASDQSARGITFSLSGVPSALISVGLNDAYQGRTCSLYIGALDSAGAIVVDPYLMFSGRIDVMAIEDSGDTATILLSGESRLIDLNRPRARRYTHEDQQIDYPGDLGLEYVAGLQDKQLYWGAGGTDSIGKKPAKEGSGPGTPNVYI